METESLTNSIGEYQSENSVHWTAKKTSLQLKLSDDNLANGKLSMEKEKNSTNMPLCKGDDEDDQTDTRCGIGSCRPNWLQKFARTEVYVAIHGTLGFIYCADGTYFNGTLSTVEKHLKIPSRTTGMIQSAFEIGTMAALPFMGYAARHAHPMRLLAGGATLAGVACMSFALPYFVYRADSDARTFTHWPVENSTMGVVDTLCGSESDRDCANTNGSNASFLPVMLLFIANMLVGVGRSAHFSVGLAYLDNNSSKNKAPIFLAATECVLMLGSTLGFAVAAAALAHYVDPTLKSPPFAATDARWIGAWWMGWPLLGTLTVMAGGLIALFPRRLPQTAKMQDRSRSATPTETPSFRDFKLTLKRLLKNKVLVFNTCSAVCLMFGYSGYWTFMPKYIETQFQKSATQANLITGSVGLVCTGAAMASAAIVIARFRPRPRVLAAWNVFTELVDVGGHILFAFLGCSGRNLHGAVDSDGSWNLTQTCNVGCNCEPGIKYEPVCSLETGTTFYSPCHAGCIAVQTLDNGTKIFNDCTCIPNGSAIEGQCAMDCASSFTLFLVMQCIMSFLQASGRSGNALLVFRCVDEKDKSLSIALAEFTLCLLAFFPAPTAYGALLDMTCLVWGATCGERGNCWLYDQKKMRIFLNFIAAGCLLSGVIFDIGVWMYCSGLKLYDEHVGNEMKCLTTTELDEVNRGDET